ncbi:MAG TPA: hypothetical protein VGR28_15475 [Candidatus Thermoplasmatota archaeon]|jgi:hypothetical protein|nr:hypothetical protein [Candidatus Thermoplasmatota archaeon]
MSAPLAVRTALRRHGLLLLSHPTLPSLARIVAGAPIRGSWWSHPRGRAIFWAADALGDDPDVVVGKLVDGRVTFVHRPLWPALLAVAEAREPWQLRGLGAPAQHLLARVERGGRVQATGDAARRLEARLLVHADETHTAAGAHAKVLEPWGRWAARARLRGAPTSAARGKAQLEDAVARMAGGATARLPWQRGRSAGIRTRGASPRSARA